jgi:hypothetical protein
MTIEFQVVYPDMIEGDAGSLSNPDPCLGINRPYMDGLLNKDEMVIHEKTIWVEFNYPMNKSHIFTFYSKDGFTREQIAERICDQYQKIYEEERETSTIEPMTFGQYFSKTGLYKGPQFNRITTNGKYGIHTHCLRALCLVGIRYDDKEGIYRLDVEG